MLQLILQRYFARSGISHPVHSNSSACHLILIQIHCTFHNSLMTNYIPSFLIPQARWPRKPTLDCCISAPVHLTCPPTCHINFSTTFMLSLPTKAFSRDKLTIHRGEIEANKTTTFALQNLPLEDDSTQLYLYSLVLRKQKVLTWNWFKIVIPNRRLGSYFILSLFSTWKLTKSQQYSGLYQRHETCSVFPAEAYCFSSWLYPCTTVQIFSKTFNTSDFD